MLPGTALNFIVHNGTSPNSFVLPTIRYQLSQTSSSFHCFISTKVSPACSQQQRAMTALENRAQRNYESSEGVAIFVTIFRDDVSSSLPYFSHLLEYRSWSMKRDVLRHHCFRDFLSNLILEPLPGRWGSPIGADFLIGFSNVRLFSIGSKRFMAKQSKSQELAFIG